MYGGLKTHMFFAFVFIIHSLHFFFQAVALSSMLKLYISNNKTVSGIRHNKNREESLMIVTETTWSTKLFNDSV